MKKVFWLGFFTSRNGTWELGFWWDNMGWESRIEWVDVKGESGKLEEKKVRKAFLYSEKSLWDEINCGKKSDELETMLYAAVPRYITSY